MNNTYFIKYKGGEREDDCQTYADCIDHAREIYDSMKHEFFVTIDGIYCGDKLIISGFALDTRFHDEDLDDDYEDEKYGSFYSQHALRLQDVLH